MKQERSLHRLLFFATPAHECSYLPAQEATTVFADPNYPKNTWLYSVLSQHGFRRSGQHIYRPRCRKCEACIPVRVSVRDFHPRRSQRRTWRANQDLHVLAREKMFTAEHFALYRRYIDSRHRGGGMDNPSPEQYLDFLTSPWSETVFYEFRLRQRLLAVAVIDRLVDGLSAVYTFFDPDQAKRSLGVYTVLWSIHEAHRLGLGWLYLGYWIEDSPKMHYKHQYQPQEQLRHGRWIRAVDDNRLEESL